MAENKTESSTTPNDPKARARLCWAEIQQVLAKHGYQLVAVPSLTPEGRVIAQVQLQPME